MLDSKYPFRSMHTYILSFLMLRHTLRLKVCDEGAWEKVSWPAQRAATLEFTLKLIIVLELHLYIDEQFCTSISIKQGIDFYVIIFWLFS